MKNLSLKGKTILILLTAAMGVTPIVQGSVRTTAPKKSWTSNALWTGAGLVAAYVAYKGFKYFFGGTKVFPTVKKVSKEEAENAFKRFLELIVRRKIVWA